MQISILIALTFIFVEKNLWWFDPSFTGFLSIDCECEYLDSQTNLNYISDEQFINTGSISNISSSYVSGSLLKEYLTVRYFPVGTQNCYTIKSLTIGSRYLIRVTFNYGNYDNLKKVPIFDIYLGVNFWYTVNASNSPSYPEIMVNATVTSLQVCLINKDQGIPFINSLHLRKLG